MKNAVCRLCRREQNKLFLKGDRCNTPKCSFTRRPYGPGKSGQTRHGKFSDYAKQLRAKQKAKTIYNLLETQFKNYYLEASKTKGKTGESLLQLIERRLDNVVYRLAFTKTRSAARQLVSHRKIMLNGKIVNIPSYLVKINDKVEIVDKNFKPSNKSDIPVWIKYDNKNLSGAIVKLPSREEMEQEIDEQLIVEFYSR